MPPHSKGAAFIVRIWRRHLTRDAPWIGLVTRISSGTCRSFVDLEQLAAFILGEVDDTAGTTAVQPEASRNKTPK